MGLAVLCAAALNAPALGALSLTKKPVSDGRPVILVLGDSLSAEYGLQRGQGWVQLLANQLQQGGSKYTVINASISGETTSGGRSRLPSLLKQHRPSIVIIELGGNDGLRGLPVARMQDNLSAMVRASQAAGARVLVAGIRIPPNYGHDYTDRFYGAFASVSKQHNTTLVPFLLEGFSDSADFFQADRIHPSKAQPEFANGGPVLEPSSSKAASKRCRDGDSRDSSIVPRSRVRFLRICRARFLIDVPPRRNSRAIICRCHEHPCTDPSALKSGRWIDSNPHSRRVGAVPPTSRATSRIIWRRSSNRSRKTGNRWFTAGAAAIAAVR